MILQSSSEDTKPARRLKEKRRRAGAAEEDGNLFRKCIAFELGSIDFVTWFGPARVNGVKCTRRVTTRGAMAGVCRNRELRCRDFGGESVGFAEAFRRDLKSLRCRGHFPTVRITGLSNTEKGSGAE